MYFLTTVPLPICIFDITIYSINTDIMLALAANDQTLSIGGNIHAFNYYLK
jgi:hypothetical protein